MTITATGLDAADAQICRHLAPVLHELLVQGGAITGSATMAWSRIERAIMLDRGPAPAQLLSNLTDSCVSVWSNADPHYPIAQGLVCTVCRHSIGWPRRDDPADQPAAAYVS